MSQNVHSHLEIWISYQPIETQYRFVRRLLEVCHKLQFSVFLNEKSPLILQDLEILKKLNNSSYVNVGFSTIFASDNNAKKVFENEAPSIKSRFLAMKKLSKNGILTGTVFMPILPFICDAEEHIESIVRKTMEAGGHYVLDGGLTLEGYCKTHYFKSLKQFDKSLVPKYEKLFADRDLLGSYFAKSHQHVKKYCKLYGLSNHIPRPVSFYPDKMRINKRVAEHFYLKSREILTTRGMGHRQYAFLKTAWILDDLKENIKELYEQKGKSGLMAIKGIGEVMSEEIIQALLKIS